MTRPSDRNLGKRLGRKHKATKNEETKQDCHIWAIDPQIRSDPIRADDNPF